MVRAGQVLAHLVGSFCLATRQTHDHQSARFLAEHQGLLQRILVEQNSPFFPKDSGSFACVKRPAPRSRRFQKTAAGASVPRAQANVEYQLLRDRVSCLLTTRSRAGVSKKIGMDSKVASQVIASKQVKRTQKYASKNSCITCTFV